jgi:hypothetical protein
MSLTPVSPTKYCLEIRSYFLPLSREPYYNPANLEKAGTGVKQKEFVQSIEKVAGSQAPADQ